MGRISRPPLNLLCSFALWLPILVPFSSLQVHAKRPATPALSGICLERITGSKIAPLWLAEHPAGGKLVVATQRGKVLVLTRPKAGTGKSPGAAKVLSTYLDISQRLAHFTEQGLLSFAFHPDFLKNGRFFVSYICDGKKAPDCLAKCYCSKVNGCSDSNTPEDCISYTVVAEYRTGGNPAKAAAVKPQEVKKWINFGRPYPNHNGGHIWFGPDGFLYFTSGDGGNQGDPNHTAQNGGVPLGKMLRIDVNVPLTGSYGIPPDNPFQGNPEFLPAVFALGFRNPWRCSVDPTTEVIFCGDVGASTTEEIDVVKKGANYGWSYCEGRGNGSHKLPGFDYSSGKLPCDTVFEPPLLTYSHQSVGFTAAVIGGYVYRAPRNKCLQGKYVYGDEFGASFVASVYASGTSTTTIQKGGVARVPFKVGPNGGLPQDFLYSWAVDKSHELYRLGSSGIYRVANASFCKLTC